MSTLHNQGPESAEGGALDPDDHPVRAGSLEDDVDCCEVCAIPAGAFGGIL